MLVNAFEQLFQQYSLWLTGAANAAHAQANAFHRELCPVIHSATGDNRSLSTATCGY